MVMPRQHVVQKKGTQKCLGFFLQCCPTAYSDSWSCQASAELRLISQKTDVPNFTRKTSHSYTAKENDWGYSCFMTWADILDESQGYIKDNTVKVEVVVKAEPPNNILDHAQFQKKIREYIRLADVQATRGFIDKAIEVNTSASKFCKDKDLECKSELETQLKRLIDLKLKESIERIEKGSNTTKNGEEDSLTNINALRQAMGGGSAARSQKAQKVVKKDGDTANKDAARKQAAVVRNNKCPPRSMEDMRRDIEKQVQKTTSATATKKPTPAIPASNRQISGLASAKAKAKTNGTTTPKIGGSTGRLPDSPPKGNPTGFRKIFNDEMRLSDNDESSNASTENINVKNPVVAHGISDEDLNLQGSDADVYVGESQISVKLSATDEPDFNLHIAKVMETLKDISPDFHEAMRKTFRNPLAMAYSEEDSFMEELYGGPQSPPVHEVSVQTEAIVPVVTETAVVDAATAKPLPNSPDDKGRKVKRVRKTRGKQENDESGQCGQLIGDNQQKGDSIDDPSEGILEYEVSGLASASNSLNYPDNSPNSQQDPPFITEGDETSGNATATRYFNSLPMNVAFDFIERIRDNDNPERPGALPPGEEINSVQFIDLMFRQNINDLIGEFVSNGQAFHVGVANNIFKTFPGYQPNRPLGAFEQRLVTNALNVVSVNCLNFTASIHKLYKFFHALNMSAKASAVNNCMSELEATIKGMNVTPSADRIPDIKIQDPPINPLEFNMYEDPDYLLDKSYRRLHEYLVAEMRFIVSVFSGFDFSYAETVTESVKLIRHLRLENERLKKMDEDNVIRQQELEEKKEHEMNEIRNSNNGDKDKINDLNKQIKELKKENKRLEKKAKQSDSQSQEVSTLREKYDKSEEKLAEITSRYNDLSSSNARDKQSWQDTKANYIREKQSLENDVKSLKVQLEESRNKTRKLEEQLASEKKSNQNQLKSEKERAIKAECSQLETTLEFGVKILERAQQDCKIQIRHFENLLKNQLSETDQTTCNKGIQAWKEKIEEIKKLITNAKAEFHAQIAEIKKGKTLATLPKITVPKPPPQPVLPPLTSQQPPQQQQIQQQQQQQQQQQAAAAAQLMQQQQQQLQQQQQQQQQPPQTPGGHMISMPRRASPHSMNAQFVQHQYQDRGMISPSQNKAASNRGSITPQPIGNFSMPRSSMPQSSGYQLPMGRPNSTIGGSPNSNKTGLLPIGVRPPNFTAKNGIVPTTPQHGSMMKDIDNAAAAMLNAVGGMSAPHRPMAHSPPVSGPYGGNVSSSQDMFSMNATPRSATAAPPPQMQSTRNSDYRWYDPLNAYSDLYEPARNNWALGGDFMSSNRNSSVISTSPSITNDPGSAPVTSNAIGMNRGPPRTGWFGEAENATVMKQLP
jgi:hypothetical protein